MNNFCLNRSGFEGLGGTSLPKFLLNAPPPPPREERNSIPQSIRLYITRPSFTYFEIKAYLC